MATVKEVTKIRRMMQDASAAISDAENRLYDLHSAINYGPEITNDQDQHDFDQLGATLSLVKVASSLYPY